jgi:hypothetical protein
MGTVRHHVAGFLVLEQRMVLSVALHPRTPPLVDCHGAERAKLLFQKNQVSKLFRASEDKLVC